MIQTTPKRNILAERAILLGRLGSRVGMGRLVGGGLLLFAILGGAASSGFAGGKPSPDTQLTASVQPVDLGPNWQAPFQKALLHPVDAQVEHFQGQLRVQTGRTNERPDYRTWPKSSFKAIPRIEMFCPGTGKDREIETFIPLSEDLP